MCGHRSNDPAMTLSRRDLVRNLACAGAALQISPAFSAAAPGHDTDWDWLLGSWDVWHVRLRKRLANNNEWDEFAGKSAFWKTLGGLGNCDENLLHIPTGTYRGLSVRSFDPVASKWSIWWLDGRMAGSLDPPVVGGFEGDEGEFFGPDVFEGKPVTVRFRWHEVRSKRPHWDQALSTDGGKTWEINWRNLLHAHERGRDPDSRGFAVGRGERLEVPGRPLARAQPAADRRGRLGGVRE
jgi:hypothetical protein